MALHPAGRPAELAHAAGVDATAEVPAAGAPEASLDPNAVTARSALSTSSSLRLGLGDSTVDLIDSHVVLPDGQVVLAIDAMTRTGGLLVAARGRPGAVRLDVTQLVPVAVRSRVRAKVSMRGTVRRFDPASLDSCDDDTLLSLLDLPPVALWAVEPADVRVTRDDSEATTSVTAYRAARPDPLAATEAVHLQHLSRHHRDVLDRLATLVDPALTAESARVVPVAVDTAGVVLRAEALDGYVDVRLAFAKPITGSAGLPEGLRTLLAAAAGRGRSRATVDVGRPPAAPCDLPATACGLPTV
ncbi:DUF2470 domain-containing protein [Micromonospora musae]|uniref:DUF2470 domain-containing protein n=1 Tax=Micromonospora musae TaxID=1894970 RepID=A0A3A9Y5E8_9ACTN|nr:DUF2470 domain-containing protein [Micromonospora musae]RKN32252.1 DUF2470 domain-containing protein [Micromonospora musae]